MKFCVVYKDERDSTGGMGLCIDLSDPTPALRYAWSRSPSIITPFDSKEEARSQGIAKCGQGEVVRGVQVLHILPHPSKKYQDLKPVPSLKVD